jgi:hypothetical protein
MNIPLNFTPPPHSPSAAAIEAAFSLLAIAADPAGAKQRIEELLRGTADIHDAVKELQDQHTRLTSARAREADLKLREQALAEQAQAQATTATQHAVTAAALQEREQKIAALEAAAQEREKALDAREHALAKKLESYRQALA